MKIAVFDTHVQRPDGRVMHFDILVHDQAPGNALSDVLAHGRRYLAAKGVPSDALSAQQCQFCHIESASPAVEHDIRSTGFAIIELEHCTA